MGMSDKKTFNRCSIVDLVEYSVGGLLDMYVALAFTFAISASGVAES